LRDEDSAALAWSDFKCWPHRMVRFGCGRPLSAVGRFNEANRTHDAEKCRAPEGPGLVFSFDSLRVCQPALIHAAEKKHDVLPPARFALAAGWHCAVAPRSHCVQVATPDAGQKHWCGQARRFAAQSVGRSVPASPDYCVLLRVSIEGVRQDAALNERQHLPVPQERSCCAACRQFSDHVPPGCPHSVSCLNQVCPYRVAEVGEHCVLRHWPQVEVDCHCRPLNHQF